VGMSMLEIEKCKTINTFKKEKQELWGVV